MKEQLTVEELLDKEKYHLKIDQIKIRLFKNDFYTAYESKKFVPAWLKMAYVVLFYFVNDNGKNKIFITAGCEEPAKWVINEQ